jgi:hypothetical protein
MANYKNRKPKSFKGHCGMCCLRGTDGRRNGRLRTMQELRAADAEEYFWNCEYEDGAAHEEADDEGG